MILGLLRRHIVNIHGTAAFVHVVTVPVKNMDSVAANATVQEGYHFDVLISCMVII